VGTPIPFSDLRLTGERPAADAETAWTSSIILTLDPPQPPCQAAGLSIPQKRGGMDYEE